MSEAFWGKRYGVARQLAWRALGKFAFAGLGYVLLLNLVDGLPWGVRLAVVLVGAVPVLIFLVRYFIVEVAAIRAFLADDRDRFGG